jgi:uncharacterized phage protein gp47/JayE
MPITSLSIYRSREDILASMLSQLVGAIPDVYTGEDGAIRIIYDIEAGQFESLYLALQLLLEDMFVSTASYQALQRYGDQYGLPMMIGTRSTGTLLFSGEDGTYIPISTLVAYDPGNGIDPVQFETSSDGTIPVTGDPTAPAAAISAGAGNLTGAYEYVVSFLTSQGESLPSDASNLISVTAGQIRVGNIPVGGPGTTGRRIYRDVNGAGAYTLLYEFLDNTTTFFVDNIADAAIIGNASPATIDTAHRVPVQGNSLDVGVDGNVASGTVTVLSDAPAELSAVTNITPFLGAADPEDSELYRQRLLNFIRNPQTGSVQDIQAWALNVPGCESAAVFENTPVNGTVTVRITGPNGSIATPDVVAAVQSSLDSLDYANITIIVGSFTALSTSVAVTVTPQTGYTTAILTPSVQTAITNYITGLQTGETLKVAGIIDAVFGLLGVADVVVTNPTSNQTTPATQKRVPGTITVS